MDKVTIEIALDRDLAEAAEQAGIDMSAATEHAIRRRRVRVTTDAPTDTEDLRRQSEAYDRYAAANGRFSDEWRSL